MFVFLVKTNFNPYLIHLQEFDVIREDRIYVYTFDDIDNDGTTEKLVLYNLPTNAAIIVYRQNGTIYESWKLNGFYHQTPVIHFHDSNADGIKELFAVTVTRDDSVFVNMIELKERSHNMRSHFVTRLERYNDIVDVWIDELGFSDITGDSIPDYIINLCAGYSLQPRAVYAWDLEQDTILRSPFYGMAVKYIRSLVSGDVNNDGIDEIFLANLSADNYKVPVKYSDTASYSAVLTKNLQFLYDPVLMGGPSSVAYSFPAQYDGQSSILSIVKMDRNRGNDGKATLFDIYGNPKDSILLEGKNVNSNFYYINDKVIFISNRNNRAHIGTINSDLTVTEKQVIEGGFIAFHALNLDEDPELEMISIDGDHAEILILQDNLKTYTISDLPRYKLSMMNSSIVKKNAEETIFALQFKDVLMQIRYGSNPFYRFRLFYYIFLYLAIYLVLYILQVIFIFRNNRRKEMENRMINLQLQSSMNQLNPHFTFNTINTVGDSILKGNKNEAYENLTKLSELIRDSMSNAFQVNKSLGNEIEFVRRYLELEAIRFEGKLTYEINVDPWLDMELKIPKMLIHIFVENAIKHGIFHKSVPGHISITVKNHKKDIVITISDDGIGRKAAGLLSAERGKGLQILNDYLTLFNRNYQQEISYQMEDFRDSKTNPGTLVTIRIEPNISQTGHPQENDKSL